MTATVTHDARRALLRARPRVRVGPVQLIWRPRPVLVVVLLALGAFLGACLSVTTGTFAISLPDVITAVLGGGTERQRFIVNDLRMPRAVGGLVAGAALGLSGALVQSVARNPLASPDILGVTSGSGAAAVFMLTGGGGLFAAHNSGPALLAAALGGGLLTGLSVFALARRGGLDGYRLVLIGVAVTGVMQALIEWMLLRVRVEALGEARAWLFGALNDVEWAQLRPLLMALIVLAAVALTFSRITPVLHLHDDHAVGLGVGLAGTRAAMLVTAVLLVGVATATCGPIAFVAFVAPQICLRLVRLPTPPLVASALVGAVLVVFSDWAARVLLPHDLPVGLVTSMIGGPYMVVLLLGQSRKVSV